MRWKRELGRGEILRIVGLDEESGIEAFDSFCICVKNRYGYWIDGYIDRWWEASFGFGIFISHKPANN